MREIVLEDTHASLVYAAQRDQAGWMGMVESLGVEYGEYINIVALIVDDPASVRKELKGKLPLFRFYKNDVKGQAKQDSSFEILVGTDPDDVRETIVREMEENFVHDVRIVTEKVFYPTASSIVREGKNAITWLYETEQGIPFVWKALSMHPIMKDHFVFFAIDSPEANMRGGYELPAVHGMLEVNDENP